MFLAGIVIILLLYADDIVLQTRFPYDIDRFFSLWKLNPRDRTITLTKLPIKHAKLTPKDNEIGA